MVLLMMTTGGQAQRHAVVIVFHAKCTTISVLLLMRQNNHEKHNCCTTTVYVFVYCSMCNYRVSAIYTRYANFDIIKQIFSDTVKRVYIFVLYFNIRELKMSLKSVPRILL